MNYALMIQKLINHHQFTEPLLKKELFTIGERQNLHQDTNLIYEKQFIKWFVILLSGRVRVWQGNQEREITLYYLQPFETCAYSVVAIQKQYQSLVNAKISSKRATLLKLPINKVEEWQQYPSWYKFINTTLIDKYEVLLKNIQALTLMNIEEQLIVTLQNFAKKKRSRCLLISHEFLANEIGTTREVVSRKLKKLEQQNRLQLGYKKIILKKNHRL